MGYSIDYRFLLNQDGKIDKSKMQTYIEKVSKKENAIGYTDLLDDALDNKDRISDLTRLFDFNKDKTVSRNEFNTLLPLTDALSGKADTQEIAKALEELDKVDGCQDGIIQDINKASIETANKNFPAELEKALNLIEKYNPEMASRLKNTDIKLLNPDDVADGNYDTSTGKIFVKYRNYTELACLLVHEGTHANQGTSWATLKSFMGRNEAEEEAYYNQYKFMDQLVTDNIVSKPGSNIMYNIFTSTGGRDPEKKEQVKQELGNFLKTLDNYRTDASGFFFRVINNSKRLLGL